MIKDDENLSGLYHTYHISYHAGNICKTGRDANTNRAPPPRQPQLEYFLFFKLPIFPSFLSDR